MTTTPPDVLAIQLAESVVTVPGARSGRDVPHA